MTDSTAQSGFSVLANSATEIIDTVLLQDRHILLYGSPGAGKSVMAARLGQALDASGRNCWCVSADPGSPAFGIPGAVSLGRWAPGGWRVSAFEGLATLDAGRFRLPLLVAVQRLLQTRLDGVVLIDGPGVVRGVAGRELLTGLLEATGVDTVLLMTGAHRVLAAELAGAAAEVFAVPAAAAAARPGKRVRARRRTRQWDDYLGDAIERTVTLSAVNLLGIPPPLDVPDAWIGRQVVLLSDHATQAMAEV